MLYVHVDHEKWNWLYFYKTVYRSNCLYKVLWISKYIADTTSVHTLNIKWLKPWFFINISNLVKILIFNAHINQNLYKFI